MGKEVLGLPLAHQRLLENSALSRSVIGDGTHLISSTVGIKNVYVHVSLLIVSVMVVLVGDAG